MAFTTALLPNRPTLDPINALRVAEMATGEIMSRIKFMNHNAHLSNDDLCTMESEGIFPIGVGYGQTYREREIDGRGFSSETALILYELRSANKIPDDDTHQDRLSEMLDRDNENGYLRQQPYSGYWIVQQAYRMGHDLSEIDFVFTDEGIVRRAMHLVSTYVAACESGVHLNAEDRQQILRLPAMQLLPEKGPARTHQGPLTVSRYIRDMVICGLHEDEILERAEWFVRVHDRAKERQYAADKMADTYVFDTFPLNRYNRYTELGTWADSDDPYLLAALAKRRDLVAMSSSKGNVIVMSKRFNLYGAASCLIKAEPDRWHYEAKSRNIIANGTESVDADPTALFRAALESIIGRHIVYKL